MSKIASAVVLTIGLAACTEEADPPLERHGWVVSAINLPGTYDEVRMLGLDIDDADSASDNQLGAVISALTSVGGYDFDAETNALIRSGAILHLVEIETTSVTDAEHAVLRVLHGIDTDADPDDNFTGLEVFGRDPTRGEGVVGGAIEDRHVEARCGTAPIAVTLPGLDTAYVLPLIGARFDAYVTPDMQLVGRLGGAIPSEHVDGSLIPIMHEGMVRAIERDCPDGECVPGSWGDTLNRYLDPNQDTNLTIEEFRANSLVQSLLAPDVDLRGGNGPYTGCDEPDGVYDALSIGAGFRAVPAEF